ncbi:ArgS-related anticodon-binding protein NrtL [Actinacidiphila epipremni]|uniref:arginine--tRNA ligase n=1 Tax=Actinacidiphila epipremni TaxID=2053013 RepID=A0ABX0ZME8_9ACTN|nr:DALR anticodon-binding domain-containing protein [Actinacidiphila epipremni]NJP44995.1 arginine--tRNA ligase [Actinacidiphila epipremni]
MTPAELSWTVLSTVRRAVAADELRVAVPEKVVVQRPPRPGCGDYATNVALQLAGAAGRSAYEVAAILAPRLAKEPGIAQVEIAGAGFLNITLSARAYADVVRQVREQGERYGYGDGLAGERVTVVPEADGGLGGAAGGAGVGGVAGGVGVRARLVAEVVNTLLHAAGARPGREETLRVAEPAQPPAPVPDPAHRATDDPGTAAPALGPDETRWALLRPPGEDTPRLTASLLEQRESNPLFRVRYAHARTRALLRNAQDLGVRIEGRERDPYRHPAETELLGLVADFPRVVETAARRRAPDRVARHMERLGDAFLRFQDECPALPKGDEKPSAVHAARLRLADATGIVLAGGLHLLGITAPDHL